MISKRLLMPMLVLGIIFTMGNMAYAQTITCSLGVPLGSTPRATATGHTEPIAAGGPTGDVSPPTAGGGTVRVSCTNTGIAGNVGVVVLTISLGVPITNTQSHPIAGAGSTGIRVVDGAGDFVAAGAGATTAGTSAAGANVGISSVSVTAGTIVIGLGTPVATTGPVTGPQNPTTGIAWTAGATSTFDLEGVLVSVNGKSGAIDASLSSTGGINIGTGSVRVIDEIKDGLTDPTVPTGTLPAALGAGITGGAAVLSATGTPIKGNFTIRIQENYADMFREAAQFNGPGTTGNFPASPAADTQVNVVLKNIPSGFDISACSAVLTDTAGAATVGTPSISATNITAAAPILTVNFNAAVDLDAVDVLWISCRTVAVGTATLPLPSAPITAQVSLSPNGAALSSGAVPAALVGLATGQIPRYAEKLQPATPVTIVVFPPSQTTLLVPLAAVVPGFETGIAIANTTADPYGTAGGGAAASEGTITFTMYKSDGTTKAFTTGATGTPAGNGALSSSGVLGSGKTYLVNLSQILSAASFGTSFTGYIFVTANFTHAHGAATIYLTTDGSAALSSPVLVLPAISSAATRGSPEGLVQ
ncbi:MAG: hypothetical protein HY646_03145 [Acidobacteria bacterium]|nr:hypothetical protein [Acidobacteriota bacterium]